MRRYRRSLQVGLLLVIAAFVASLFVFGQRGFGDGSGRDAVATVNGEAIPLARYERAYQSYVNMYSQNSRQPITPELAERLGLDRQVMDTLVQEALVVQRARAEGLEATDDEVNAEINAQYVFHENGRVTRRRVGAGPKRARNCGAAYCRGGGRAVTVQGGRGV